MPLPASGTSGSIFCCGPKTDIGKPKELVSLATQPMIGTVRADWSPCWRLAWRKLS